MISFAPNLNSKNILNLISEEQIFKHYCEKLIKFGENFPSEFRKENNPSARIDRYKGKLIYKDFGEPGTLNCFGFIMRKYNCNFIQALSIINTDFNLKLEDSLNISKSKFNGDSLLEQYVKENEYTSIRVLYKEWCEYTIQYVESYKLDYKKLSTKFKVKPIDYFWINNVQLKADVVSFSSFFGKCETDYCYKIYQPFSKKRKWYSNINQELIQGYTQLPKRDELLVITKSYKDVWCFDNFGISSVAPGAEGWQIPDKKMDEFFDRFERIIVNYDFDKTGISNALKLKRRYGVKCLFFTNGRFNTINYKIKDFADYCRTQKQEEIYLLLNTIKSQL